jgi:hypothetical protein
MHQHTHAGQAPDRLARSPESGEASTTAATVRGLEDRDQKTPGDCGAERDAKRFATLRAQAAIAGHELTRHPIDGGGWRYAVSRWGLHRDLADLHAVQRWIEQATGRKVAA